MVTLKATQLNEADVGVSGPLIQGGFSPGGTGAIQTDWNTATLGDFISLQRGHDLTSGNRREGTVPIMGSAGQNGCHDTALAKGPGVVLGRSGASFGHAHYCKVDFWPHNTALYVTDFRGNDPLFVYYFLSSIDFTRHNSGGAQQSLNRNFIYPISVTFPSTEKEQQAIAAALSDADALIESLEQLIAKKRQIKQGAMQELLTGKKRLPGFTAPWGKRAFGEIAQPRMERIDPRRSAPSEFCLELEHIQQGTGQLLGSSETSMAASLKSVFKKDDVLFGKLRAYLRKYWLATRHGVCSTEIWVLAPAVSMVVPQYLYELVTTNDFIEVASSAYGTHMPRSDWNVVKAYEVSLPRPPEQIAIAAVLSDMDTEIAMLHDELVKAKQIKKGMMQLLLTGRIRLV
jgi:type I restriction enzyme S subunit